MVYGTVALAVGTLAAMKALATDAAWLYLVAIMIAGTGYGTEFSGVLRSVAPLTATSGRAGLFASIYLLANTANSLPLTVAGLLIPRWGATTTIYRYSAAVAVLALVATILRWRR